MRTLTLRRVVVTGLGAVTDCGHSAPATWDSMIHGRSGIGPVTAFAQSGDWSVTFGGEVRNLDYTKVLDPRDAKRMDRYCIFG